MDNRILAICDPEENYAYRMMEVLQVKKDIPFEIHVFTQVGRFIEFNRKAEVECLLVSESAYCDAIQDLAISHVIILNESGELTEENKLYNIYKYQSADHIVSEILNYYSEKAVGRAGRRIGILHKNRKIIGIYTPVKRCLQTTFSMTLGQMLARNHKTLYLNFECFSGLSRMFGREFKADITDLVYFYECIREKFVYRLAAITEQVNGMDFIPPAAVYPDLMNIPGKQWTSLLQEIKMECGYEYILLDLSDYVNGLIEILQECDMIFTITRGDTMAVAKMEEYEKMLHENHVQEVAEMTCKLNLPIFKNLSLKFSELTYGELASYIKDNLFKDICGL